MKNPVTILLNIGYWFLYLISFSLFYNAINYPSMVYLPILPDREIFSITGAFVIIPSVFAFYAGYTVLFDSLLVKRRYLQFVSTTITVLLLSYGIMVLLNTFPAPFYPNLNFSVDPAFLFQYGTSLIFLALINCFTGIIMRGFVVWVNSRSPQQGLSLNSAG